MSDYLGPLQNPPPARSDGIGIKLSSGNVLFAGGWGIDGTLISSSVIYNIIDNGFYSVGDLNVSRAYGPPAILLDDGNVLVVGGLTGSDPTWLSTASCELYNPNTGLWTFTGSLSISRQFHAIVKLIDGRVLAIGGSTTDGGGGSLDTCEIYDPILGTWSPAGSLNISRDAVAAVRLVSGKILVASWNETSSETYDPDTDTWSIVGDLSLPPQNSINLNLLNNNTVLSSCTGTDTCELFDPNSNTWSVTGSLSAVRFWGGAVKLSDGNVLVFGGTTTSDFTGILDSAEIYNVASGTWSLTGSMNVPRMELGQVAASVQYALLDDNTVLVYGGWGGLPDVLPLSTAEIYYPDLGTWGLDSYSPCLSPTIDTQPSGETISLGDTAILTVVASGTLSLSYQWYEGLSGDTSTPVGTDSNTYTTPALTTETNYWVRVTGQCDPPADSTTATISINSEPYLTIISNVFDGPPTLQATWPTKTIVNCVWAANEEIIVSTPNTFLVPTIDATYSVILTASDSSVGIPNDIDVTVSYVDMNFELITYNSIANASNISRYATFIFDIIETHGKYFPLSYVNFSIYQNGAVIEDLTKTSSEVSYSEISNGWRFVINGGEIKHRFKSGSNITVTINVANN